MGENTKIEWAHHSWNPWIGCQKISAGCDNCLHPDTLVLYRDWTWRKLSDVRIGDELLGFPDSDGMLMRRLEISKVEKIWGVTAPALEISTDNHRIISSYDHKFVARQQAAYRWRTPRNFRLLTTGLRALPVTPIPAENKQYMSGYLVGATEGDGTFRLSEKKQSYWRVAVIAAQREFLDRIARYLKDMDIVDVGIKPFNPGRQGAAMIRIETRRIDALMKISAILDLAETSNDIDFARGWLAGMFDAEGSSGITYRKDRKQKLKQNSLRIANTVRPRIERIVEYGEMLGFDFQVEKYRGHCYTARLEGGAHERGRFYGTVRPALTYKTDSCLGTGVPAKPEIVKGMQHVGDVDLIDIQTSTGTFFANGFAVHNCYAEALAERYKWTKWGPHGERKRTSPANWKKPLAWNRKAEQDGVRRRVFCASLADIFDNQAPPGAREDLFRLILKTTSLDWLLLTKRPENFEKFLPEGFSGYWNNVWLGVTAEDQAAYDRRWPILRDTDAAFRFISYEPALGPLSIDDGTHDVPDWIICGGESGSKARPMNPEWARSLRDEVKDTGVAFFFKQWGAYGHDGVRRSKEANGRLLDGRTWDELPFYV